MNRHNNTPSTVAAPNPHLFILTSSSLILLTFFIFLCSRGSYSAEKERGVLSSMRSAFTYFNGGGETVTTPSDSSLQEIAAQLQKLPGSGFIVKITSPEAIAGSGPTSLFFIDHDDQLTAAAVQFLSPMTKAAGEKNMSVQIIVKERMPEDGGSGSYYSSFDRGLRRAGSIYRLMIDSGIPSGKIEGSSEVTRTAQAEGEIVVALKAEKK